MAPKSSSKKDQIAWLLCEKCKVYITSKDRDKHEKHCPFPNEISASIEVTYSFIHSKQFFSTHLCEKTDQTAILSDELLNDLGSNYLNNLVFASESAINLCDWIVSDFVVIQPVSENFVPVVRRIWPVTDKNTSNVFVTDEGELSLFAKWAERSIELHSRDGVVTLLLFQQVWILM